MGKRNRNKNKGGTANAAAPAPEVTQDETPAQEVEQDEPGQTEDVQTEDGLTEDGLAEDGLTEEGGADDAAAEEVETPAEPEPVAPKVVKVKAPTPIKAEKAKAPTTVKADKPAGAGFVAEVDELGVPKPSTTPVAELGLKDAALELEHISKGAAVLASARHAYETAVNEQYAQVEKINRDVAEKQDRLHKINARLHRDVNKRVEDLAKHVVALQSDEATKG